MQPGSTDRPYARVVEMITADGSRGQRMQRVVDALWDALKDKGVSWVGFYLDDPDKPDAERLFLGPYRDKPACARLGIHGVCGQAVRFRTPRIVHDARELGSDYIECDLRDRAEIAIPMIDTKGQSWGVLDLDSYVTGAFCEKDADGLSQVLRAAGLM